MKNIDSYQEAIELLSTLITLPSLSKEEDKTANYLEEWLINHGIEVKRKHNNVWAKNKYFSPDKPTILLNSHHDTVHANVNYNRDPFEANIEEGKLFGLGSNDAGGAVVSLITAFLHFHERKELKYNLILAITAEEEISGKNGISSLLSDLPKIDFALVGEPTEMHLAVAEKGLLVIDGHTSGQAGHAAHHTTENAITKAIADIAWISSFEFDMKSEILGATQMNVTQINAGTQHNVVPGSCHFVIDVRVNDNYSNQDIFEIIDRNTTSELTPRSFRLNSSGIALDHPVVIAGGTMGRTIFGSSTLSDQALMPFPSLKIGPGKTERSHTADEFIYLHEIEEGIEIYKELLTKIIDYEIMG